jgi:signal transduction histidine kinase
VLARSDAGALPPPQNGQVDLDDIVVRLARRLRAGGRVHVDLAGVSAAQVRGDPDQLTRAIANLADNAARHATSSVAFAVAEHDHTAVLTVTDDGPGIPREHHAAVFERFTRLDDARTSTTGGAGLGLAIARDLIVRHGGTLIIDPAFASGTRFVLTLPLT